MSPNGHDVAREQPEPPAPLDADDALGGELVAQRVAGAAAVPGKSIDRAVHAAGQLPAEQSADLLAAARDAFTSGVHVVGIVSAVFYAGLAVLAIRAFKHVPKATGDDTTNADRETDRVPEAA